VDNPATIKNDPYASLRIPEFNYYLVIRFALVFALAMQFTIVEWKVNALTHDPFALGLIGLAEVIPAVLVAPFAGHIVDKREKRGLLLLCVIAYIIIGLGLFGGRHFYKMGTEYGLCAGICRRNSQGISESCEFLAYGVDCTQEPVCKCFYLE
jgi:MFS family permease